MRKERGRILLYRKRRDVSFKLGHRVQQADTQKYGCALPCSGRSEDGLLVIPLTCNEDGNCKL